MPNNKYSKINPVKFQQSINDELQVVKNRVRDLIGDRNWGEEGRFKEAILRNMIKRFLPENLSVGNGFILNHSKVNDQNNFLISRQIDILIYDNTYPIIFSESDFVIVTEDCVRGIIEVKSKIYSGKSNRNSLYKIINKFNEFADFERVAKIDGSRIFKGIFSFDTVNSLSSDYIKECLEKSNGMINHFSLNDKLFIRHWLNGDTLNPPVHCENDFYNIYDLPNLSHAYFISNLVHMTSNISRGDRYFISFPIEGTKEVHRVNSICLNNVFEG